MKKADPSDARRTNRSRRSRRAPTCSASGLASCPGASSRDFLTRRERCGALPAKAQSGAHGEHTVRLQCSLGAARSALTGGGEQRTLHPPEWRASRRQRSRWCSRRATSTATLFALPGEVVADSPRSTAVGSTGFVKKYDLHYSARIPYFPSVVCLRVYISVEVQVRFRTIAFFAFCAQFFD